MTLIHIVRIALLILPPLISISCAPFSSNAKYLYSPNVDIASLRSTAVSGPVKKDSKDISKDSNNNIACPDTGDPAESDSSKLMPITIRQGTICARTVENEYCGAQDEYASIPAAFGTLLIPVGSSALALAGTGQSAAAVTSLGFGSAAILAGGYLLSNKKREKVYMTGASALECLIDTMGPFDKDQNPTTFENLSTEKKRLEEVKEHLDKDIPALEAAITQYHANYAFVGQNAKKMLCYAEKTLSSAKTAQSAAIKANDSSGKYLNYSEDRAGREMVNDVHIMDNKVRMAMIDNEPDLQKLASNLSGAIPATAQSLAGINAKTSDSKKAADEATMQQDSANQAKSRSNAAKQQNQQVQEQTEKKEKKSFELTFPRENFDTALPNIPSDPRYGFLKPVDQQRRMAKSLSSLIAKADRLFYQTPSAIGATNEVVDLTPSEITPNIKACTDLFKESTTTPQTVLTLNPYGDILIPQGGQETVEISNGNPPYTVMFLGQRRDINATEKVAKEKASIVIQASNKAKVKSSIPLMVTDSTGIGKVLNIVVVSKKPHSSTEPDCL
jgi:hypothetical protein